MACRAKTKNKKRNEKLAESESMRNLWIFKNEVFSPLDNKEIPKFYEQQMTIVLVGFFVRFFFIFRLPFFSIAPSVFPGNANAAATIDGCWF